LQTDDARHEPVLVQECLEWLVAPEAGGLMIDGTVGDGGHAERFLDRYPSLALLAVDVDERMLHRARRNLGRFGGRVQFEHGWFADVLARRHGAAQLVLLDLGVASYHFDRSGRGFSFRGAEPLDMRLSDQLARTAADILNEEPESALADLFHRFGEERHARRLARAIVRRRAERSFRTSDELEQVVWRVYPRDQRHRRIHPATRAFQALRIAVNDELQRLDQGLTVAIGRLAAGGRLGVIAFHSLEDRIVKQRLRDAAQRPGTDGGAAAVEVLTRRPLRPSPQELERNPRARSACLRVARKVLAHG
jgi:16S rRNA (cytosine1402-N4)-methyltransferase